MLTALGGWLASWRRWREEPMRKAACRAALSAAIKPLEPAVARIGEHTVRGQLAAALPLDEMWKENGGARWNGHDDDLNAAMAPLRWQGLLAAERAGAAYQFDCAPAIWAWEVNDLTWQAALGAIDVAMAVCALQSEGLPVTTGMADTYRAVLEIATSPESIPMSQFVRRAPVADSQAALADTRERSRRG